MTPLRKAKKQEHGQPSAKRKSGSEQDDGGFKAQVNSGKLEVRFMIYPTKRKSFNLCMRLREFITEAQSMDSRFESCYSKVKVGNASHQQRTVPTPRMA
jgi:hypothetical protein